LSKSRVCFVALWLATLATDAACSHDAPAGSSGASPGTSFQLGGAPDADCTAPSAGDESAAGGPHADCSASESVDYARDVAPILENCAGEVCHHFDPSTLRGWIGAPADECCNQRELIAPGQPERSYLIDKLEGQHLCYGARMPLDRAPLTPSEIAVLKSWICGGATLP
jgi:hypothetical protein